MGKNPLEGCVTWDKKGEGYSGAPGGRTLLKTLRHDVVMRRSSSDGERANSALRRPKIDRKHGVLDGNIP